METSGPAPNLFTYNVMMRTFAEAGRTQVMRKTALVRCCNSTKLLGVFIFHIALRAADYVVVCCVTVSVTILLSTGHTGSADQNC
jgi:hypothetical protein